MFLRRKIFSDEIRNEVKSGDQAIFESNPSINLVESGPKIGPATGVQLAGHSPSKYHARMPRQKN